MSKSYSEEEEDVGVATKPGSLEYMGIHYIDRSNDIEPITTADENSLRLYRENVVGGPFPNKLHIVLKTIESLGQEHIISWLPHGRAFMIHRPNDFEEEIMGKFFKQTKLTSFRRQLNLYDFRRLTHGKDAGAYYHELFLRGKPLLAKKIVRRKLKGSDNRAANYSPDDEPNFYRMPFMGPSDIDISQPNAYGKGGMMMNQNPSTFGHNMRGNMSMLSNFQQLQHGSNSNGNFGVDNSLLGGGGMIQNDPYQAFLQQQFLLRSLPQGQSQYGPMQSDFMTSQAAPNAGFFPNAASLGHRRESLNADYAGIDPRLMHPHDSMWRPSSQLHGGMNYPNNFSPSLSGMHQHPQMNEAMMNQVLRSQNNLPLMSSLPNQQYGHIGMTNSGSTDFSSTGPSQVSFITENDLYDEKKKRKMKKIKQPEEVGDKDSRDDDEEEAAA